MAPSSRRTCTSAVSGGTVQVHTTWSGSELAIGARHAGDDGLADGQLLAADARAGPPGAEPAVGLATIRGSPVAVVARFALAGQPIATAGRYRRVVGARSGVGYAAEGTALPGNAPGAGCALVVAGAENDREHRGQVNAEGEACCHRQGDFLEIAIQM
jgi:hypothetical protein